LKNIKAVAAGFDHTVVLSEDGIVTAWGNKGEGQCSIPKSLTNIKAIAAGRGHTVVLNEEDTITGIGFRSFLMPVSDSTYNANICSISGFVAPDFYMPDNQPSVKDLFAVRLGDTPTYNLTKPDGSFKINTPITNKECTVKIEKRGYLTREIKNIKIEGPQIALVTEESPIIATAWSTSFYIRRKSYV